MNYEELLIEADENGVSVDEDFPFKSTMKGLYIDGNIALASSLETTAEKACILAEELGHHFTAVGNITDQSSTSNRKQERQGRIIAYNKLIGLSGIVSAYKVGCRNTHEMAEHLEVTEEFLLEALDCYRQKYGTHTCIDNYTVYFEPTIGVFEVI